jgi:thymidylate synthase (FAD)
VKVTLIAGTTLALTAPTEEQPLPRLATDEWLELLDYNTMDADHLAEFAGRACYQSWDRPNPKTAANKDYLANIIAQGHASVLEHASATFYIEGVSRNFTHELIRHRHLSFSEVSQRYVDVSEYPFVEHPGLVGISADERRERTELHQLLRDWYEVNVAALVRGGKSRKEARQAARHILPGGTETKIVVTGNMRSWREVLSKRLSPAADAEFREVAKEILRHLKEIAPHTFQDVEVPE